MAKSWQYFTLQSNSSQITYSNTKKQQSAANAV